MASAPWLACLLDAQMASLLVGLITCLHGMPAGHADTLLPGLLLYSLQLFYLNMDSCSANLELWLGLGPMQAKPMQYHTFTFTFCLFSARRAAPAVQPGMHTALDAHATATPVCPHARPPARPPASRRFP